MTFCDWHECLNEASDCMRGVHIKPPSGGTERHIGDLNLCPRHFEFAKRTGRLNLDWERVLR